MKMAPQRYPCQILSACKCYLIWKEGPVFEDSFKDPEMKVSSFTWVGSKSNKCP